METSPGAIGVAAIIATAGLLWFVYVLKSLMSKLPAVTRYGFYVAIWLAYFILVLILAAKGASHSAA